MCGQVRCLLFGLIIPLNSTNVDESLTKVEKVFNLTVM